MRRSRSASWLIYLARTSLSSRLPSRFPFSFFSSFFFSGGYFRHGVPRCLSVFFFYLHFQRDSASSTSCLSIDAKHPSPFVNSGFTTTPSVNCLTLSLISRFQANTIFPKTTIVSSHSFDANALLPSRKRGGSRTSGPASSPIFRS